VINYLSTKKITVNTVGKNQVLFLTIKTTKMNCQLCRKEIDAYRGGKLPADMMTQVESHLKTCEACAEILRLQAITDRVMNLEKETQSDPFMSTRIMALINNTEAQGYKTRTTFTRALKPVLVTVSMAAAILYGVLMGNLSNPGSNREKIPLELALIDDATIESLNILTNE
jgi:hypothetical protein